MSKESLAACGTRPRKPLTAVPGATESASEALTPPCPRCAGLAEEVAELRREVDRLADMVREIERGEGQ